MTTAARSMPVLCAKMSGSRGVTGPALAFYGDPLWPAGHLPHEGGDRPSRLHSPIANVGERAKWPKLPISPLVGEMAGRPEGGAKERDHRLARAMAGAHRAPRPSRAIRS